MKQIAGMLLKLERLRQQKGQKEVCLGICVPSYLCKIEQGKVQSDGALLQALFLQLGITYESSLEFLEIYRAMIEDYYHAMNYELDRVSLYEKLVLVGDRLKYSELAVDWLLIQCFHISYQEEHAYHRGSEAHIPGDENQTLLSSLEKQMSPKQHAYYQLLQSMKRKDVKKACELCICASQTLGQSIGYIYLASLYLLQGEYAKIHRMENQVVALAVEEGNTAALAEYFFYKGSAYACLNMESMMETYYVRAIHLLQNTGWKELLEEIYYNMGATYISSGQYNQAGRYLDLVKKESFFLLHKKALIAARSGKREEAERWLANMQSWVREEKTDKELGELICKEVWMELKPDFTKDPTYVELMEELIPLLEAKLHFGFVYFYKDMMLEAYMNQRKYKKAFEFTNKISSNIENTGF